MCISGATGYRSLVERRYGASSKHGLLMIQREPASSPRKVSQDYLEYVNPHGIVRVHRANS